MWLGWSEDLFSVGEEMELLNFFNWDAVEDIAMPRKAYMKQSVKRTLRNRIAAYIRRYLHICILANSIQVDCWSS